jgi:pimeloyl-ACP methyl ester carboxylesterase
VQPYGVIVPAAYDGRKPMRLDVVLHGSTRPVGMSELRFLSRFDEGDEPARAAPEADYIELHPLGRVENCYRWAGETDVFEAIEAVARNYQIDRDRIVLRGMSMGASGTWHLGLKHPDRFVALGPYCGYVDTHQFSETPLPNFIKVGPLPPHQERGLHMLDSIDYAANAGVVPAIACMGDKDVFFQAHVIMGQAMAREGLKMVNLISPGTGHVIDPATHKEQMRRIQQHAAKGLDRLPRHIRFVTWTLKYSRCHWLQVLGLEEHYARGELEATLADDGAVEVKEPRNITRFAILPPVLERAAPLRVGGQPVELPARQKGAVARGIVIGKRDGKWACLGDVASAKLEGKRPGLQGPIDDAFTTPFLCVRGTGKPWNPPVQAWSEASLQRFASEWHDYFRGELPVKDDSAVTDDDLRRCNLILFGDPGSNRWIGRVLPSLPIRWTQEELEIGQARYAAADHTPLLIHPNPLAAGRYVVLGSGHTFHEHELASLNYLLFPRLGDWAVLKVGDRQTANPSEPLAEAVAAAGFCDERWQPVGIAMMPGGQSPSAAAAEAATDSIRVADRKELPFDTFPCERIALGEPDDYKPCLALLPGGELLMTAFHQHPREGGKVLEQDLLFRSRDGGRTWSAPEKLGLLGREPYLTVLKDGTLFMTGHLLANDVRNPHGYTHGYLHRSTDAGKTWKSVRIESEGIRPKAPNHSSRNVVQMPDGTLLLGVDYDGGGGPYFVWRSKDGGKTWDKSQRCEPLGFKSKYGFFQGEAWLWLAKSGKLLALVRVDSDDIPIQGRPAQARDDQDDHFVLYESSDGAKTFRRVGDLGDYGEMYMSLLRLQDERLLLTFTVRKRNPPLGVRAILGVEHDDGFTLDFAHDRLLLDTKTGSRAQGGGFGPTVQLKDGSLVTCCSYRGADDKTHLEVIRWRLSR